ncbi:hypothetical protein Hypma_003415 [Hypsizygus marmoreus]|uniref:Uncharacterized protein n=1 Tax=Hypsizygus marmoreus TaxID=39966 RepID=A0A369J257_HYPMA|nr:hypothetical protein Hypma_003415 [Hypsizygus marmoreus]
MVTSAHNLLLINRSPCQYSSPEAGAPHLKNAQAPARPSLHVSLSRRWQVRWQDRSPVLGWWWLPPSDTEPATSSASRDTQYSFDRFPTLSGYALITPCGGMPTPTTPSPPHTPLPSPPTTRSTPPTANASTPSAYSTNCPKPTA